MQDSSTYTLKCSYKLSWTGQNTIIMFSYPSKHGIRHQTDSIGYRVSFHKVIFQRFSKQNHLLHKIRTAVFLQNLIIVGSLKLLLKSPTLTLCSTKTAINLIPAGIETHAISLVMDLLTFPLKPAPGFELVM